MKKFSNDLLRGFLAILISWALATSAQATTRSWTGNGINNKWSTAGNWSPSGAPQDGDTLVFNSGAVQKGNANDLVNRRIFEIQFTGSSGGYAISGNPILLDNDISA